MHAWRWRWLPLGGAPAPGNMLSAADVAAFRRDGFLVLPSFVREEKCEAVRRQVWAATASALPHLRRSEPDSWVRPAHPSPGNGVKHGPDGICPHLCWFTDEENVNLGDTGRVQPETGSGAAGSGPNSRGTTAGDHSDSALVPTHVGSTIGHRYSVTGRNPQWTAALRDLIPDNPDVLAVVQQLLGPQEDFVGNFDGNGPDDHESGTVYCTLPNGDAPGEPFPGSERHGEGEAGTLEKHQRAHFDGCREERSRLNVTCYIDAVQPRGGGLLLWPRSHTRIHRKLWSREGMEHRFDAPSGGPVHPEVAAVRRELAAIVREGRPWAGDCYGPVGTVVLWHHRMAHMGGQNFGRSIRQAVIYRYAKTEAAVPESALDTAQADLWRDWAPCLRSDSGGESAKL